MPDMPANQKDTNVIDPHPARDVEQIARERAAFAFPESKERAARCHAAIASALRAARQEGITEGSRLTLEALGQSMAKAIDNLFAGGAQGEK